MIGCHKGTNGIYGKLCFFQWRGFLHGGIILSAVILGSTVCILSGIAASGICISGTYRCTITSVYRTLRN